MSVQEIMRRFASGLPLSGNKIPYYDETDERPDPATLDLSELKDEIEEINDSITDRNKAAREKVEKEKAASEATAAAIAAAKEAEAKAEATLTRAFRKARKSSTDDE